jgi:hypothetical protein
MNKKKSTTSNPTASPQKNPQGNRTEGTKHYKDPTGKNSPIHSPKNSGYDEKQPC